MASHRAQMHKSAIEAARYGVGISLLPGPPIPPDGDCLHCSGWQLLISKLGLTSFQLNKGLRQSFSLDSAKLRGFICRTALISEEARKHFPGTTSEWEKAWQDLSKPGKYELEGADLMVAGLGVGDIIEKIIDSR